MPFDNGHAGLTNGHTRAEVPPANGASPNRATTPAPAGSGEDAQAPYFEKDGRIVRRVVGTDGIPLTNFTARIVRDVRIDDGVELRRQWRIEASCEGRTATFDISPDRFAAMTWPSEQIGAVAFVNPGQGTKDHAKVAIQILSGKLPEDRVYAHTGWRKVDARWAYLHAGGAIGEEGPVDGVEVGLPDALADYTLPTPPTGAELQQAIRASLRMLLVAPPSLAVPVYAAIWRAPIGECDFGLHLAGRTGSFKSELAALAQQHFGARMNRTRLPANWTNTANANEEFAFSAKDALLVIDDYVANGSLAEAQKLQAVAERLIRGAGNRSGRSRLTSDRRLVMAHPPRALILSTGEDVPRGQSLQARIIIREVRTWKTPGGTRSEIRADALSLCQADAAAGAYAKVMAGYVKWLAPRFSWVTASRERNAARLRKLIQSPNLHRRTPDAVAKLALGLFYFCRFARHSGVLTARAAHLLWRASWHAPSAAASEQAEHYATASPARRFVELLGSALSQGRAHVVTSSGGTPDHPHAWGWHEDQGEWRPQGAKVGWLSGDDLLLDPDAALGVVQDLAQRLGEPILFSSRALNRLLKDEGIVRSTDTSRGSTTSRKTVEGVQRAVLVLGSRQVVSSAVETDKTGNADEHPGENGSAGPRQALETGKLPDFWRALEAELTTGSRGREREILSLAGFVSFFSHHGVPRFDGANSIAGFAGFRFESKPATGNETDDAEEFEL